MYLSLINEVKMNISGTEKNDPKKKWRKFPHVHVVSLTQNRDDRRNFFKYFGLQPDERMQWGGTWRGDFTLRRRPLPARTVTPAAGVQDDEVEEVDSGCIIDPRAANNPTPSLPRVDQNDGEKLPKVGGSKKKKVGKKTNKKKGGKKGSAATGGGDPIVMPDGGPAATRGDSTTVDPQPPTDEVVPTGGVGATGILEPSNTNDDGRKKKSVVFEEEDPTLPPESAPESVPTAITGNAVVDPDPTTEVVVQGGVGATGSSTTQPDAIAGPGTAVGHTIVATGESAPTNITEVVDTDPGENFGAIQAEPGESNPTGEGGVGTSPHEEQPEESTQATDGTPGARVVGERNRDETEDPTAAPLRRSARMQTLLDAALAAKKD